MSHHFELSSLPEPLLETGKEREGATEKEREKTQYIINLSFLQRKKEEAQKHHNLLLRLSLNDSIIYYSLTFSLSDEGTAWIVLISGVFSVSLLKFFLKAEVFSAGILTAGSVTLL